MYCRRTIVRFRIELTIDLLQSFQLFEFADKYRGTYDSSIIVAQNYYRSFSGYEVIKMS